MKTITILFLCVLGVLAIVGLCQGQSQQNLCDDWGCTSDCFEQGLHGQCDSDGSCRCYNCIYRACRKFCNQQGQVGQCDENHCLCL